MWQNFGPELLCNIKKGRGKENLKVVCARYITFTWEWLIKFSID